MWVWYDGGMLKKIFKWIFLIVFLLIFVEFVYTQRWRFTASVNPDDYETAILGKWKLEDKNFFEPLYEPLLAYLFRLPIYSRSYIYREYNLNKPYKRYCSKPCSDNWLYSFGDWSMDGRYIEVNYRYNRDKQKRWVNGREVKLEPIDSVVRYKILKLNSKYLVTKIDKKMNIFNLEDERITIFTRP